MTQASGNVSGDFFSIVLRLRTVPDHGKQNSANSTSDSTNPNVTSNSTSKPQSASVSSLTPSKRPWRLHTTPFPQILSRKYRGSGTESDPFVVDWLENDPEDALNWSATYRWSQVVLVSLATLAVTLSSSAYTGGIEDLEKSLGASQELLTAGELGLWGLMARGEELMGDKGVSLFVLGFAFGPL